jgi:nicotinamidase-related amidase
MVVLMVIDMQVGLFGEATPRFDAEGVVQRINILANAVRAAGGSVIFIQHDGQAGGILEPDTQGWELLPSLEREKEDLLVRKQASDAFYETDLENILNEQEPKPLIITGCATDFCVDTTIRAAASRDYDVIVAEDGHTTANRPHLKAVDIIQHHNWVWKGLILPRSQVRVLPAKKILSLIKEEN